ncbi:MAG: secondary thiamine-phosphate synthase enzyme YjbQ [Pseudomonadota bacterium]|nr:secondary thiamine-phosphate synthase enzyme YjbQ [Pseudomonadota bacterium]MEC8996157.1 secondary thiamine-phosphate synthase enzyme YjbQ [Pseudomonadota bacterium]
MKQFFTKINIKSNPGKLMEFTNDVINELSNHPINNGLATLYIKHTSASLLIQENADPDVLHDLENFFNKLAPQDLSLYKHKAEGPDDMSAHIRSALTCTHLSIPIVDNKLELGTWQGIFLFEHRNRTHVRTVQLHIVGE